MKGRFEVVWYESIRFISFIFLDRSSQNYFQLRDQYRLIIIIIIIIIMRGFIGLDINSALAILEASSR